MARKYIEFGFYKFDIQTGDERLVRESYYLACLNLISVKLDFHSHTNDSEETRLGKINEAKKRLEVTGRWLEEYVK